ncbi:Transcriptional regulator, AraC family [Methanosarcina barkeri str. Wiesmoor]|uniref:Transcriptional regulator, AraC family n=2 Tax=Methanosarcina barkeri TaxID=2208 RepID=A0A0E3LL59_METBA|nr:DJ-1/PfpI family protein [Methanosarcina barkeri]AKB50701.1 Transcriptional regulator, AraC family [Methanosarcina barkeri str. Wiesmoor]
MNFGFLIYPGLEELDLVGPWEIISLWSKFAQGPNKCFMVAENPAPVICSKGMSINPHVTFADCPPLDFLLVPGGEGTQREVDNPPLIQFVAEQAENCKAVLSVCTGAFILHRAGLLSNRRATTHWASLQKLRDLGDVEVVEDRIVRDRNIWTSAGISAGIDLAFAFIEYMTDEKTAGKIQLGAEYYPSGRSYGMMHKISQAPEYLRKND